MSEIDNFRARVRSAKSNGTPNVTMPLRDAIALSKEVKECQGSATDTRSLEEEIIMLKRILEHKNTEIEKLSQPVNVIFKGDKF